MSELPLAGDAEGLYMACPAGAAAELAGLLAPGPVLELCCGVGGLTRELAKVGRKVLAVDQSLARLQANRANLAALGLERRVSYLCCDLRSAALRAPAGSPPFAVSLLDPDWSPPGKTPENWAAGLADMEPPADELIRLGLGFSPLLVIRLPRLIKAAELKAACNQALVRQIGQSAQRWRWLALQRAST